jgi:hypothetical protein
MRITSFNWECLSHASFSVLEKFVQQRFLTIQIKFFNKIVLVQLFDDNSLHLLLALTEYRTFYPFLAIQVNFPNKIVIL